MKDFSGVKTHFLDKNPFFNAVQAISRKFHSSLPSYTEFGIGFKFKNIAQVY